MAGSTEAFSEMPPEKMASLIHELQVHQVELEMQNDELRRVQGELEKTRDRYAHLYDFAPLGYFTLSEKGIIEQVNLTDAAMIGIERSAMIGKLFSHFILRDDQDIFYKLRQRLLKTETSGSCELRLVKKDGLEFYALLECMVIRNRGDEFSQIRTAISDITERKHIAEALQEACNGLEQRVEERTVELRTALSEIETLKEQLEIENIYFRRENKMRHRFDHIVGRSDGLKCRRL
ncbi:MAG: PAS domain-containing protein [Desulfobacterales bacterium]|nr:PAS domain-containing protein [Desulfobacterales bacterium]